MYKYCVKSTLMNGKIAAYFLINHSREKNKKDQFYLNFSLI